MSDSLSLSPVFRRLSPAARNALADRACETKFARNERIVGPGAPTSVHLLVRGLAEKRVRIARTPHGNETVWLIGPGELVGTSAVLPGTFEDVEVVALEQVASLAFTPHDILALGRTHPEIFLGLAKLYAQRLVDMAHQSLAATTDGVVVRLAQVLLGIVPSVEGDRFVPLMHRLTHQTLSRAIGASRPYTTEILAELERQGALRREGRTLLVRPEVLRSIALKGAES